MGARAKLEIRDWRSQRGMAGREGGWDESMLNIQQSTVNFQQIWNCRLEIGNFGGGGGGERKK
jgi:hypothetical protein